MSSERDQPADKRPHGDGASHTYDGLGRLTRVEDGLDQVTAYCLDSDGVPLLAETRQAHREATAPGTPRRRHSLEFRLCGSEAQEQSVALGDWGSGTPIVAIERVQAFLTSAEPAARALPAIGGIEVHAELAAGKVLCRAQLSDFQPTDLVVVRVELALYASGGGS